MHHLQHVGSKDHWLSVVPGDGSEASGCLMDLAAVVNATSGQNDGHFLAEVWTKNHISDPKLNTSFDFSVLVRNYILITKKCL